MIRFRTLVFRRLSWLGISFKNKDLCSDVSQIKRENHSSGYDHDWVSSTVKLYSFAANLHDVQELGCLADPVDNIEIERSKSMETYALKGKMCYKPKHYLKFVQILLAFFLLFSVVNGQCSSACDAHQVCSGLTWVNCNTKYPGWYSCNNSSWLSCSEGLFYVDDQHHCVESCQNIIDETGEVNQFMYFADSYARKCLKWGTDCQNCINDVGWTSCLREEGQTEATSFIRTIANGKQQWDECSTAFSDCELCTSTEWTFCRGKMLSGGVWTDSWNDPNCHDCNSDKAVWQKCANGYVLDGGSCVQHTCTVENCNDCATNPSTEWDLCKEGFFLSSLSECTSWIDQWLQWSDSSTCDVCEDGYILSQNSESWIKECEVGEYIEATNLNTFIGDIIIQKCKPCHSEWEEWLSNGNNNWIKCSLGKFLSVVNPDTIEGTWINKSVYNSNDDIFIYVSNDAVDYAKSSSNHLGTQSDPDIDLMSSVRRADMISAQYSTKNDGSNLSIHILLYKGDHYLLRQNISPFLDSIDFYSKSYELKISPLYCDLFSSSDTSHCVNTSDESDVVTIYNKLGSELFLTIPMKLTIENVVFDMIEGFITPEDDPDNCLETRKKWCVYDNGIAKVDSGQTETCQLRIPVSDFCHRVPKYTLMNFHPFHSQYGLTAPPELVLQSVTMNNVFYDVGSIVDFNIGGFVTISSSTFRRFSNCGSIVRNSFPVMINAQPSIATYSNYYNNFILRK